MWLSRRERRQSRYGGALTGPVTVSGRDVGAWLEGERRGVAVYAPGGYHWAPAPGQEVLVLKTGERGEQPCAVGVADRSGLKPGEVLITGGKCSLLLGLNGTITVSGQLVVNGTQVGPSPAADKEG